MVPELAENACSCPGRVVNTQSCPRRSATNRSPKCRRRQDRRKNEGPTLAHPSNSPDATAAAGVRLQLARHTKTRAASKNTSKCLWAVTGPDPVRVHGTINMSGEWRGRTASYDRPTLEWRNSRKPEQRRSLLCKTYRTFSRPWIRKTAIPEADGSNTPRSPADHRMVISEHGWSRRVRSPKKRNWLTPVPCVFFCTL